MSRLPPAPYFVLRSHQGAVTALGFIEDQQHDNTVDPVPSYAMYPCLLSGSDIGEIFLWNLKVNRVVCSLHQPDEKMILWLTYFRRKILSQIREVGVKIWSYMSDGDEWVITGTISIKEPGFCSSTLLNTHKDAYFVTPGPKRSYVSVLDFNTCEVTAALKPPDETYGMCMCLTAFTLNERENVICGYENGSIVLWDCQNAKILSSLSCHKEPVMCLDFDKNYKRSGISGSADDCLSVWKLDDKFTLLMEKKIKLKNPGVASIAIRGDGKIAIVGGWDSRVRVFSWKSLRPLAVLQFHNNTIHCLRFSLNEIGKYKTVFAAGSKDKNVSLWSIY